MSYSLRVVARMDRVVLRLHVEGWPDEFTSDDLDGEAEILARARRVITAAEVPDPGPRPTERPAARVLAYTNTSRGLVRGSEDSSQSGILVRAGGARRELPAEVSLDELRSARTEVEAEGLLLQVAEWERRKALAESRLALAKASIA